MSKGFRIRSYSCIVPCMSKTITIDDEAYKLLCSLKRNGRDSFTKVILRNIYRPAETCGELLDMTENDPPQSTLKF